MAVTTATTGVAAAALAGRKELALLDDPSVAAVAGLLAARCRAPAPWIRAAVATLWRFAAEVAGGDLPGLLRSGRDDASAAQASLTRLAARHDGCTAAQLASLSFGPTLWWRVNGVDLAWRGPAVAPAASGPIPGVGTGSDPAERDVRLLLLALVGSGLSVTELIGVRAGDAGSLDASGRVVPDLDAEPLAMEYRADEDGTRWLTFLPYEARVALRERLAGRCPEAGEPLLLPDAAAAAAVDAVAARSAALIGAGNDVNVTLCRATGDFFRTWGMPGARFDPSRSVPPTDEESP